MSRIVIDGVDRYRVMEPLFEPVRVVLSYRGEEFSPDYIQGISGAAFRIAGICPCAPTCSCAIETQDLIRLLGYEVEYLPLHEEGIGRDVAVHEVLSRVRGEIRAGRPAILWHAFTFCEWDVISGFDDEERRLLGRGSYVGLDGYASAEETRTIECVEICPALGAILVGEKIGEFRAREAELAALREAVRHAHSRQNEELLGGEEWAMLDGLLCYDRWISDFGSDPVKVPNMGDRYCFGVYRSTHRAASGFMCELSPRYPAATEQFAGAARHFASEADALNECAELLFPCWRLPDKGDREVNDRAAALLSQARDHYARAIEGISDSLRVIGAESEALGRNGP
jgi:hypothetical protein